MGEHPNPPLDLREPGAQEEIPALRPVSAARQLDLTPSGAQEEIPTLRQVSVARQLDLTPSGAQAAQVGSIALTRYSAEWARIVKPIGLLFWGLIAAVMLLPFLLVFCIDGIDDKEKAEKVLEWAKTVLPPAVGFGGALIGYYFGTHGTQQEAS